MFVLDIDTAYTIYILAQDNPHMESDSPFDDEKSRREYEVKKLTERIKVFEGIRGVPVLHHAPEKVQETLLDGHGRAESRAGDRGGVRRLGGLGSLGVFGSLADGARDGKGAFFYSDS